MLTLGQWIALSAPLLTVLGGFYHLLSSKLDAIGEHLERQDKRHVKVVERMARVEGKMGLNPLPLPDDIED